MPAILISHRDIGAIGFPKNCLKISQLALTKKVAKFNLEVETGGEGLSGVS